MEEIVKCGRCGKQFMAFSKKTLYCDACNLEHKREYDRMYKATHKEQRKEIIKKQQNSLKLEPAEVVIERAKNAKVDMWKRYQEADELGKMSILVPRFHELHPYICSYGNLQIYAQFHGIDYIHERARIERKLKNDSENL